MKNDSSKGRRTAKRALALAAVWLALIAMVFVHTDRDEYTYRYGEGDPDLFLDLNLILESVPQAQQRQDDARAHMDVLREEAAERTVAGIWGKQDIYEGALMLLPARADEEPGLNLMWGDYEVTVDYISDTSISMSVDAEVRQAFVKGGAAELAAAPEGASASFSFSLLGSAPGVMLACDLPEGAQITGVTVRKAGTGVFSRDLAAYAALAGFVLTALFILSWDERPGSRERRRDAMILVCAALFASVPSLWYGLIEGHDLLFHLNRIEGIAAGLRAGEFPVRIHSTTLLGYGYAAPEFYPELFLYLPALMRNLGVSPWVCLAIFQMLVNLGAAFAMHWSAHRLFTSRRIAVGSAVLYTLCVDRVANLYVRGSLGESVALAFFPILIAGLADVIAGNRRRWPVLTLGMLGVFMSHMLSTLFAIVFCTFASVLGAARLLKEPKRILAILKAAAVTVICSLWFVVPFLQYSMAGINTNLIVEAYWNTLKFGSLLIAFSGNLAGGIAQDMDYAYHIGVVPGVAIMAGCALLIVRLYMNGGVLRQRLSPGSKEGRDKLALSLLFIGTVALLCATDAFPWKWACTLRRPFGTVFMQVQFPWRLVGVASPLLSLAAAYGFLKEDKTARAGMTILLTLSVVFCGFTLTAHLQNETLFTEDAFIDTRITQFEYTYVSTEKEALEAGRISADGNPVDVLEYDRSGSSLRALISHDGGCSYLEMPMLYYPGYRATVDGAERTVTRGTNNVLRIYSSTTDGPMEIRVWFDPPAPWLAAQAVSAIGAVILMALLLGVRRRTRVA